MKHWIYPFLALIMSPLLLHCACGSTIYVKHDATGFLNNGISWENAYIDLQTALNEAEACGNVQEIWVAGGTYKPSLDPTGVESTVGRYSTFGVFTDVRILGGFCGWESHAAERVKYQCPTILSGDHNDDDILIDDKSDVNFPFSNDVDNSYNIMWTMGLTDVSIIDGFTFSGGNANHPSVFLKQIGGAIFNDARGRFSSPRIVNCIFERNKALEGGGAIYNYGVGGNASPRITASKFKYNRSADHGGAFFNHASGASRSSNPIFSSCLFEQNLSAGLGGGIYSIHESSAVASPQIIQSTFVYNEASLGAGMFVNRTNGLSGNNVSVNGCIFFFNNATDDQSTSSYGTNNVTITPQYSLYPEATVDQVNFNTNANPQFVNMFSNFRLQSSSPAIDKGEFDSGFLPSSTDRDIDDNSRRIGDLKDIGAYEFLKCPIGGTIYVDSESDGMRNGVTPSSALSSINMALNMACNCSEPPIIDIAEGRYVPHRLSDLKVDDDPTNHSFVVECSVIVQGHEGVQLSGDILYNDNIILEMNPTREDNCNHLIKVFSPDTLRIDSIELRSSNDDAVLITNGSLDKVIQVANCIFNYNGSDAIAVVSNTSSIRVENCIFEKNFHETDRSDGCINIQSSDFIDIKILNCDFRNNEMGGIFMNIDDSSRSLIEFCRFNGNTSIIGAGIEVANATNSLAYHTIRNCEFLDNAASSGAAIYGRRTSDNNYIVDNCTFFRNHCSTIASATVDFFGLSGSASIRNSIFWKNTYFNGLRALSGDMDVSYSIIEASSCNFPGQANIRCGEVMLYDVDPMFRSEGGTFGADLYLKSNSPAINRGSKRFNPLLPNGVDISGSPRIQSNRNDLGAYEYNPISAFDCLPVESNPIASPDTNLDISIIASDTIRLSQEYITPETGALFLDAPEIKIYPSLEIETGAVLEVHVDGCEN